MWALGDASSAIREIVDEAQARAIIAALRKGVTLADAAVYALTPTTLPEAILDGPLGPLIRWASPEYAASLISDHKKAALKAIKDTIPLINKLEGEWWQAAKTGVPASDGTATWTEWKRKALLVAEALQSYVDYQIGASWINLIQLSKDLVVRSANCTIDPASCVPPPSSWPWYVWLGAGSAALLGGAYLFNTFAPRRR